MIWGFTGTRHGATDSQLAWLYQQLEDGRPDEVHHGSCVGVDLAVHHACIDIGIRWVHVWPPVNFKWLAQECIIPKGSTGKTTVTVHPRMQYLPRDREIVHAATVLKALPKQEEQPEPMLWGGTWYTVEFAQRVFKPVDICYPSGRVENRRET
jgi:hypothetical protein